MHQANDPVIEGEMLHRIAPYKWTSAYRTLRHWRDWIKSSEYRAQDASSRAAYDRFRNQLGGRGLRYNLLPRDVKPRTALIVSLANAPIVQLDGLFIKAFQLAGFETFVLGAHEYKYFRYYRLAGAKVLASWSDFETNGDPDWVTEQLERARTMQDILSLTYDGVHTGRFAVASAMRSLKRGQLDLTDADVRKEVRSYLNRSVRFAQAGRRVLEQVKPDCTLFLDRGYVAQGELFDRSLAAGIDVLSWAWGYKSDLLYLKRFTSTNERDHCASLSPESWRQIRAMAWSEEYGASVRHELFRCYESQDWFGIVGTQFATTIHSKEATRHKLGLPDGKKVAVIFPHILWDGSFFSGEDLFDDYTHWLAETIREACENTRLSWVVKLHPAHVVKSRRENIDARPSELRVIEQTVGALPDHVTLVHPETDLSTYSLFEIADYTVTVRGTVGIEAALFGIPVVTAGTGSYAFRGFTLDSTTRHEYLSRLRTLESQPAMSMAQRELAQRYAYGVFMCRPLRLSSVSLAAQRDALATCRVEVRCQQRQQWLEAADMRHLADWIADGRTADLFEWPTTAGEYAHP